jgi:hypothetical protein
MDGPRGRPCFTNSKGCSGLEGARLRRDAATGQNRLVAASWIATSISQGPYRGRVSNSISVISRAGIAVREGLRPAGDVTVRVLMVDD